MGLPDNDRITSYSTFRIKKEIKDLGKLGTGTDTYIKINSYRQLNSTFEG